MATDLRHALDSVRALLAVLHSCKRDEVQKLIDMELAGARRRSVGQRLAQRAARLEADATYQKIMREFSNG